MGPAGQTPSDIGRSSSHTRATGCRHSYIDMALPKDLSLLRACVSLLAACARFLPACASFVQAVFACDGVNWLVMDCDDMNALENSFRFDGRRIA